MKNLYYTILIALSAAACFAACSDNQSAQIPEDDFFEFGDELTICQEFIIPDNTRAEVIQRIRINAKFDVTTEKITDFQVQKLENDIAVDIGISQEELNELIKKDLGENFTDMAAVEAYLSEAKDDAYEQVSFGKCLRDCNTSYTDADGNKIKGRGRCKATCWADAIMYILKRIFDIADKAVQ